MSDDPAGPNDRVQVASVQCPGGRLIAVYRPDFDLWLCLNRLIFGPQDKIAFLEEEIARSILSHCSDAPNDLPPLHRFVLADRIVNLWNADIREANRYREAIKKCLRHGVKRVLEMEKLIAIKLNPSPEIEASLARTIESKLLGNLTPTISESLAARLAARQAPPPKDPDTGRPASEPASPSSPQDLDQQIADLLKENPLLTSLEIARRIKKSESTVRRSASWKDHQARKSVGRREKTCARGPSDGTCWPPCRGTMRIRPNSPRSVKPFYDSMLTPSIPTRQKMMRADTSIKGVRSN